MEESLNTISAEELFGAANRLIVEGGEAPFGDIASLGGLYQAAIAVVAVVYIFTVVKFSDVLFFILGSLVKTTQQHANDKVYSSVINNVERMMALVGVVLIGLAAMRFSITPEGARLFMPLPLSPWGLFGATASGVALLIIAEVAILYLIRTLAHEREMWQTLTHTKLLHFSAIITLITPPMLLALLTQGTGAVVACWVAFALCFISLIIFVKEVFSLFILHKFSLFHCILYLCTLELFPLSLLLAPILRR